MVVVIKARVDRHELLILPLIANQKTAKAGL